MRVYAVVFDEKAWFVPDLPIRSSELSRSTVAHEQHFMLLFAAPRLVGRRLSDRSEPQDQPRGGARDLPPNADPVTDGPAPLAAL